MFYVIMGVSGTGKSTIGQILSDRTGWKFYDADDFHSPANLERLSRGVALTDRDRQPWLQKLRQLITRTLAEEKTAILACSALKAQYRQILQEDSCQVVFIYLRGDYDCIQQRVSHRQGHFMNSDLLRSQFDTLEEPEKALIVDVTQTPEQIVDEILRQINR